MNAKIVSGVCQILVRVALLGWIIADDLVCGSSAVNSLTFWVCIMLDSLIAGYLVYWLVHDVVPRLRSRSAAQRAGVLR